MSKIMESLKELVDFLGSYPGWAKILMITSILIMASALIFAPRKGKTHTGNRAQLPELIESSSSAEEFMAKIILSKDTLEHYLKERTRYESVDIAYNIKVKGQNIDLVVYYHYNDQGQVPHVLTLVKFYDPTIKSIDWDQLNNDWNSFIATVKYDDVKTSLMRTPGFNSPLEYPWGRYGGGPEGEMVRPIVFFNQTCGRRKRLNQVELSQMQQLNVAYYDSLRKTHSRELPDFRRIITTYDNVLEGFNFISGG